MVSAVWSQTFPFSSAVCARLLEVLLHPWGRENKLWDGAEPAVATGSSEGQVSGGSLGNGRKRQNRLDPGCFSVCWALPAAL